MSDYELEQREDTYGKRDGIGIEETTTYKKGHNS